jgi:dTDP-4-dehydrorhamnose reductase
LLVLGATGLLGQAFMAEARARGMPCSGVARSGADHAVDVTDTQALRALLCDAAPAVIVNCVAVTSHALCEEQPELAFLVNARTPGLIAQLTAELGARFVHISSDHFFSGDGSIPHDEGVPVRLVNEYARSKYAGESLALTDPSALAIRTNIVGIRGWPNRPTFAEWALDGVENARALTLFDDFFTSSMHTRACAKQVLDLVSLGASGLINVASSRVSSKREFVQALAQAVGADLRDMQVGSVRELVPRRAESLGLDVTYAERLLGRRLPDLDDTITAIVAESRDRLGHEIQH